MRLRPELQLLTPVQEDPPAPASGWWLSLVVFFAGAALMAYEIVGSRLLAPSFGNSTYVWGSLIGVFLAALAAGYTVGGRLADRWARPAPLAIILAVAAVLVMASQVAAEPLQRAIVDLDLGIRANPLLTSVALFGPASILIGMVSPWAVRLRATSVESMGRTAGSLYGLSTAGSIVGTLAASFWLVQEFGSDATVAIVAVALAACGALTATAGRSDLRVQGVAALVLVGVVAFAATDRGARDGDRFAPAGSGLSPVFHAGGYEPEYEPSADGTLRAQTDSSYHRIRVVDYAAGDFFDDAATRVLHFDNSMQASARLLDGEPVTTGPTRFSYQRAVDVAAATTPGTGGRALLVGLGSGAAAMRLHELRPDLRIDVVELDGKVVEVARRWFGYRDAERGNDRIRTHVADGRAWLGARERSDRYDLVLIDAYFADSLPFHLTTREFLEQVQAHLADDGVASANLIGAVEGPRSELVRSMHRTWSDVFADVVLYPVPHETGEVYLEDFNNIELFAARSRGVLPPRGGEAALVEAAGFPDAAGPVVDTELRQLVDARYADEIPGDDVPVLRDDLAPVDSLLDVSGD